MDKILLQELLKTNYAVIAEQTVAFLAVGAMLICFVVWSNGLPIAAGTYLLIAFIRAMPRFKRIAELKLDLS